MGPISDDHKAMLAREAKVYAACTHTSHSSVARSYTPRDLCGVWQGASSAAQLRRSLRDTMPDTAASEGASDAPGAEQPPTSGAQESTSQYVADNDPAGNVLITMPDGPMRHNKALYDAGHNAVRAQLLQASLRLLAMHVDIALFEAAAHWTSATRSGAKTSSHGVRLMQTVAAVELLKEVAENASNSGDQTVVSKKVTPPTGTKRTYYSLDTYSWPSNGNETDLTTPWTIKDGYVYAKVRRPHALLQGGAHRPPRCSVAQRTSANSSA